jgi:hypothetical protein
MSPDELKYFKKIELDENVIRFKGKKNFQE